MSEQLDHLGDTISDPRMANRLWCLARQAREEAVRARDTWQATDE